MLAPTWAEWFALDAIPQWDAVALSLGVCPHALRGSVPSEPRWPSEGFRAEFDRRRYALDMASLPHGGRWDGAGSPFVELRTFIAWATRASWDLPQELTALIEERPSSADPIAERQRRAAQAPRADKLTRAIAEIVEQHPGEGTKHILARVRALDWVTVTRDGKVEWTDKGGRKKSADESSLEHRVSRARRSLGKPR